MQELKRLGAPLLQHIAKRIAQITEHLNPPLWLPVTDAERQKALEEQLARAWRAYQIGEAQEILKWAGVTFYESTRKNSLFPEPALAILGEKPISVDDRESFLPPVPATVITYFSDDYQEATGPKSYIIHEKGKPPWAKADDFLITNLTLENSEMGAQLRLESTPKIVTKYASYTQGGNYPVSTYCPMETYHQLQTIPQGTLIVPDDSMLIIGCQPSFDKKIINMEIARRKGIVRRPIDFLWVKSFKSLPSRK